MPTGITCEIGIELCSPFLVRAFDAEPLKTEAEHVEHAAPVLGTASVSYGQGTINDLFRRAHRYSPTISPSLMPSSTAIL